jgi:membrane protein YqaA with SNARE-associated domain
MRNRILFFGLIVVFAILTVWFASIEPEGAFKEFVVRYGYLGFLGVAFLGGLNFAVPSLHLAFIVPLLNVGLELWLLVILAAIGTTLADGVGYGLGRSGEKAFSALSRLRSWGKRFVARYPRLAPIILVGWASFVPMPNEIFVIPAGVIRYGFWRTIFLIFAGNVIFNLLALNFGNLFV